MVPSVVRTTARRSARIVSQNSAADGNLTINPGQPQLPTWMPAGISKNRSWWQTLGSSTFECTVLETASRLGTQPTASSAQVGMKTRVQARKGGAGGSSATSLFAYHGAGIASRRSCKRWPFSSNRRASAIVSICRRKHAAIEQSMMAASGSVVTKAIAVGTARRWLRRTGWPLHPSSRHGRTRRCSPGADSDS